MESRNRMLILNNIKLTVDASFEEAFSVAKKRLASAHISTENISFHIHKRSIDARKKDAILFVYSVCCNGEIGVLSEKTLKKIDGSFIELGKPEVKIGNELISARPIVVGAGPAGLFAALMLAENGYAPIIIERGGDIDSRNKSVKDFTQNRVLDENTNIQFGLGGAGTFSDGKLITRINDTLGSYVLSRLVEFGAPREILYSAKPHIGTDILSSVVSKMAERIQFLGGDIHYNTKFMTADFENRKLSSVVTSKGKYEAGALILAIGHSARDTYKELINRNISIEAKNFSVGMRIEHPAKLIDEGMYGKLAGDSRIGHAEYTLSYNTKERGAYTFCMCPGGEVVAAASENSGVVVNGMSNSKRDGNNSNSAVVVSVFREDYGKTPASAIEFQRKIEHDAYIAGGSDYSAPIITVGDFIKGGLTHEPTLVAPTYMNGGVKLSRPERYLPEFITNGIRGALLNFDKKISGFAADYAILSGAETRTSAPLRILRNDDTKLALGYDNFYPAGEGAGYAGGITSASIDGVRVALALMARYKTE